MRVAFLGTPAYAVPTLDALVDAGHEVVCVVAQPDRPVGRGQLLQSPPTVVRARELEIETRQPRGIRSGPFPERFCALELDLAVVVAYGRILTPDLLAGPRLGCLNAHGSLLPRWRGAAPIERAILAGDRETGVCTMQMEEGLDTGPVYLERRCEIGPEETALDMRGRLSQMSAALVVETLKDFEERQATPQDETGVTWAHPLVKSEGRLDWGGSADSICDRIRAFHPWPGTWCEREGVALKIHAARPVEGSGAPGEIMKTKGQLVVACGEGALEVLEAQLPGKRSLPGSVLANGARIGIGEVLS